MKTTQEVLTLANEIYSNGTEVAEGYIKEAGLIGAYEMLSSDKETFDEIDAMDE